MLSGETVDRDGIVGELFLPTAPRLRRTLAIVLGGSSGGLRHAPLAARLADDGVAAFALAYFGVDGLPERLERIELTYFARALSVVRSRALLSDCGVVLIGQSRGAELALQIAAALGGVVGVVATSPSHLRWGATGSNEPAWVMNGEALPHVMPVESADDGVRSVSVGGRDYRVFRQWYLTQSTGPSAEAATIGLARADCPILLFSGLDDQLWPSAAFADKVEEHARAAGALVQNVKYEGVGHVLPLPDEAPRLHAWHPAVQVGIAYGGSEEHTRRAAFDRWERLLQFLGEREDTRRRRPTYALRRSASAIWRR